MLQEKKCNKCGQVKPISMFPYCQNKKGEKLWYANKCKQCRNKESRDKRREGKPPPLPTGLKRCNKCNEIKTAEEFHKCESGLYGVRGTCKSCILIRAKTWYQKLTDEERQERNRKARPRNNRWRRNWSEEKKARIAKQLSQKRLKKLRSMSEEELQELRRKNTERHKKYRSTTNGKIAHNLRVRLKEVLRGRIKAGRSVELLGCSVSFFKEYLERQFRKEMNWSNYGEEWAIDHIQPLSSFDLSNLEQQKIAFHYTNMQPLSKKENNQKFVKIPHNFQLRFL